MDKISERTMSEVRNYLVVVVRNQAIDIYRKHKKVVYSDDELEAIPDNTIDTPVDAENKELQEKVFGLVKGLDQSYSDVLMMKYFYGFKTAEIAQSLGISQSNVRTRLSRGAAQIRLKLAEEGAI